MIQILPPHSCRHFNPSARPPLPIYNRLFSSTMATMGTLLSPLHWTPVMEPPPDNQFVSHYPAPSPARQSSETPRVHASSRSASPTQYAFITSTGTKSPAAARQDLREVRSHVMKVHLRRQQQKGRSPSEALLSAAGDRRRGKQARRASRSTSRDTDEHVFESDPSRVGIGMVFPCFSTVGSLQFGQTGSGMYTFSA